MKKFVVNEKSESQEYGRETRVLLTGIDLSEAMLKVANKKNSYEDVKFTVADASNLPFKDSSFDVSGVSFALHDMLLPIREKALKEMVRVTKPGGIIVIVDYALPEDKIRRFLNYHFVKLYEGKYYIEFIKSEFEALLRKSGIEIVEKHPILLGAGRILKGSIIKLMKGEKNHILRK